MLSDGQCSFPSQWQFPKQWWVENTFEGYDLVWVRLNYEEEQIENSETSGTTQNGKSLSVASVFSKTLCALRIL